MPERVFTQTFGVVGAVIERDGKILLVKEASKDKIDYGKWNRPGGWIDVGENPIDGVKREVEEETGYKFTPEFILGIYSAPIIRDLAKAKGQMRHPIDIVFLGKISDKKVRDIADDVSETKWFTQGEIEAMSLDVLRTQCIKTMVKDYFAGKRYPLDLLTHTIQE